ncbi:MAG: DUF2784 domain-containing protein [Sediminispirochaetaceae bacterium]
MNSHGLTADIIVFVHLLYLLFTVGGEALILTGGILKWRWVRNLPFRITHLVAVVLVSLEAVIGMLCPLTELEYTLRRAAGQTVEEEISLVGRIIRSILFYDFPAWFFTGLYVGFGILVILTLFLFPPARKKHG